MDGVTESITGPVDFALIVFEGNEFSGEVAPVLVDLQTSGTVRVLDAAFVSKDADGSVTYLEVGDTDAGRAYAELQTGHVDLLSDEDLQTLADGLEPASSGLVLVWENTWASRFADTVRAARGYLKAFERVPHDQLSTVLAAADGEDA